MNFPIYTMLGLLISACNTPIELGNRDGLGGSDQGVGGNVAAVGGQTGVAAGTGGQRPVNTGLGGQAPIGRCGNAIVESGEVCDDGNNISGDGCSANCTSLEMGFVCAQPGQTCQSSSRCGDGKLLAAIGEVCDDGNTDSGDGCAADCRSIEPGWVCMQPGTACSQSTATCGDGKLDIGEDCDMGTSNNQADYNGCTSACKLGPHCGDGIVQTDHEQCDDGLNTVTSGCSPNCTLGSVAICGNAIVEAGEECDDGSDYNDGSYGGCEPDCMLGPYCGDGLVEASEECDLGTAANDSSYGGCTPACTRSPFCGDGVVNSPAEMCDVGTLNGSTGSGCTNACKLIMPVN